MSEEDKIKLENELLLTKSKAQMINLYLDLQQKVEQLEKEYETYQRTAEKLVMVYSKAYYDEKSKNEQLESIKKEAIEYVYKHIQEYDADGTFANLDEFDFIASPQVLLNILNKGDNNGK